MVYSETARSLNSVAAKKSPKHHPSTTVLDSFFEVFLLICCHFHQTWRCALWPIYTTVQKIFCQSLVVWLDETWLGHILFREKRCSPANSLKQAFTLSKSNVMKFGWHLTLGFVFLISIFSFHSFSVLHCIECSHSIHLLNWQHLVASYPVNSYGSKRYTSF